MGQIIRLERPKDERASVIRCGSSFSLPLLGLVPVAYLEGITPPPASGPSYKRRSRRPGAALQVSGVGIVRAIIGRIEQLPPSKSVINASARLAKKF
jgi:hypothetical protein